MSDDRERADWMSDEPLAKVTCDHPGMICERCGRDADAIRQEAAVAAFAEAAAEVRRTLEYGGLGGEDPVKKVYALAGRIEKMGEGRHD